jgi:hypothetical protein
MVPELGRPRLPASRRSDARAGGVRSSRVRGVPWLTAAAPSGAALDLFVPRRGTVLSLTQEQSVCGEAGAFRIYARDRPVALGARLEPSRSSPCRLPIADFARSCSHAGVTDGIAEAGCRATGHIALRKSGSVDDPHIYIRAKRLNGRIGGRRRSCGIFWLQRDGGEVASTPGEGVD